MCGEKFTQSDHLKTHLVAHTGEKKLSRNIYEKTFTQPNGLKYHTSTHTVRKNIHRKGVGKKSLHQVALNIAN